MSTSTHLVHLAPAELASDNPPCVYPVYQSISFSLPSVEEWEKKIQGSRTAFSYSGVSNPTLATLEGMLARLQGRDAAFLTTSGKAAMAAVLLSLLRAGDHVVLFREGYRSTRHFLELTLARFGVQCTIVPMDDANALEQAIAQPATKLLLLESPTNPLTRVMDLEALTRLARERGIHTVLDNSIAGFHNHCRAGVDLFVHSLSKYGSGHGDVMGGVIIGNHELISRIRKDSVWNQDALDPAVAGTILRGMTTYSLRMRQQTSSAAAIAAYLADHPVVTRLLYPGHTSHPDHAIALRQMNDFGPIIAFDLDGGDESMRCFVNGLRYFKITFGTGFPFSIVNPAYLFYARAFPNEQHGPSAITPSTIRLSIGLEDCEDLIEDLAQALNRINRSTASRAATS